MCVHGWYIAVWCGVSLFAIELYRKYIAQTLKILLMVKARLFLERHRHGYTSVCLCLCPFTSTSFCAAPRPHTYEPIECLQGISTVGRVSCHSQCFGRSVVLRDTGAWYRASQSATISLRSATVQSGIASCGWSPPTATSHYAGESNMVVVMTTQAS